MSWNEAHVWMPQSWKQGQVRFILNNDKPQTICDAQPITLLNAHHNMHSHMLSWRLKDSMTTLCLASHCAFIANRHIRNKIMFVTPWLDPTVQQSPPLSSEIVDSTLSAGSQVETHKKRLD